MMTKELHEHEVVEMASNVSWRPPRLKLWLILHSFDEETRPTSMQMRGLCTCPRGPWLEQPTKHNEASSHNSSEEEELPA